MFVFSLRQRVVTSVSVQLLASKEHLTITIVEKSKIRNCNYKFCYCGIVGLLSFLFVVFNGYVGSHMVGTTLA